MKLLARTRYFGRSALLGMRHSPFVHAVAVTTLAIALFTAGLARGAVRLVDGLRDALGGEVEVTVYLDDALSAGDGQALAERISTRVGGHARWVSPDEALGRLAQELGELADALGALPDNPLPSSVELKVPPELRGPASLAALAQELRLEPGVAGVDYGEAAVARLSALSRALRLGSLGAFLVIVLAAVIITSATLQLAIYARREEIEIQKLVGATNRFVKAPFLIEGAIQGVAGAVLAVGGLWGFSVFAAPRLDALFGFLLGPGRGLALWDVRTVGEIFAVGVALGLCGSFVAVGRFLRV